MIRPCAGNGDAVAQPGVRDVGVIGSQLDGAVERGALQGEQRRRGGRRLKRHEQAVRDQLRVAQQHQWAGHRRLLRTRRRRQLPPAAVVELRPHGVPVAVAVRHVPAGGPRVVHVVLARVAEARPHRRRAGAHERPVGVDAAERLGRDQRPAAGVVDEEMLGRAEGLIPGRAGRIDGEQRRAAAAGLAARLAARRPGDREHAGARERLGVPSSGRRCASRAPGRSAVSGEHPVRGARSGSSRSRARAPAWAGRGRSPRRPGLASVEGAPEAGDEWRVARGVGHARVVARGDEIADPGVREIAGRWPRSLRCRARSTSGARSSRTASSPSR